jgi:hypothetical protein
MGRIFKVTGCALGLFFIMSVPALGQIHSMADTMAVVGDTVRPGDTVNVIINMVNTFNVGGFSFRIEYDSTRLHLEGISLMPRAAILGVFGADTTHPGAVRFFAVALNPLTDHMNPGSGPVANIGFTARWNAFAGPVNLTFEDSLPADNSISDDTGLHVYIPVLVNGLVTVIDGSDINDNTMPQNYSCDLYNYPNPFNSSTKITFSATIPGNGVIDIYDMLGRRVRRFNFQSAPNNHNDIIWDGLDESGREVGSGVYCYTLFNNDVPVISKKMIFLR